MAGAALAFSSDPALALPVRDRLIVALDLDTVKDAHQIITDLGEAVTFYKIGLSLQFDRGLHELLDRLLRDNKRVFIDFKSFDIPAQVERAVKMASRLGISFITVIGQEGIVQAAVRGRGSSDLKILVVTLLTYLSEEDMRREYNTNCSANDFIKKRARYAADIGCNGVISSAKEVELIRNAVDRNDFLIVTPGIRPHGVAKDDQKRVATPYDAILSGANFLVVGRPITQDPRPEQAAYRIIREMEEAQSVLDQSKSLLKIRAAYA